MTKKVVKIKGQDWLITKPDDIYEEMSKSESEGYHVSDWAWQHAKYIGKRLNDGDERWLPWNYKQFIIEYIK